MGKGLGFTVGNYFSSQDSKDMRFAYISGVQWVWDFNLISFIDIKCYSDTIHENSDYVSK